METEIVKSTHKVEVVPVSMEKHPNADSLSLIPIFGYTYVGRTEDWQGVSKAAWCPPDSLVDTRLPEFAFLAGEARYAEDSTKGGPYARIKAKKLRGIVSYGLLLPVEDSVAEGADLAERFAVLHYEPPIGGGKGNPKEAWYTGGETCRGPALYSPKYDVDSFQRYAKQMFVAGEPVWVTEKIHGANGRWVFHQGQFYCGSRTEWKNEYAVIPVPDRAELIQKLVDRLAQKWKDEVGLYLCGFQAGQITSEAESQADKIIENINRKNAHPPQNLWWKALRAYPSIMEWLQAHPDVIVYGEAYGQVQNLKYGTKQGEVRIGVFDLLKPDGTWMDADAAKLAAPELPWVPQIAYDMPYNFDKLVALAEGNSVIPGANHIREGVVVKPIHERNDPRLGRVLLKIINPSYLEKD